MTELILLSACILVYLYSFLYRKLSIIATALIVCIAYLSHANLLYVGGLIFILVILRMNKSGIKDEY